MAARNNVLQDFALAGATAGLSSSARSQDTAGQASSGTHPLFSGCLGQTKKDISLNNHHRQVVQVKICGITRLEDALAAVDAGADALGFVFHPPSPRYITPAKAAAIIAELPPFTTTVGVFVNKLRSEIEQIVQIARIQVIQLQGDESPDDCADLSRPVIKAFRFNPDGGLRDVAACRAQAVLVDSGAKGQYGGTGIALDWTVLRDHLDRESDRLRSRLILAGGLTSENVVEAVRIVQPRGVDVASGTESEPGIKSHKKIREFIHAVKD